MEKKPKKISVTNCHNGTTLQVRLTQAQYLNLRQIKATLANTLGREFTDTLIVRRALDRYHQSSSLMSQEAVREEAGIIAARFR